MIEVTVPLPATRLLAEFAAGPAEVPSEVRETAKDVLVNALAVAVGASNHPITTTALSSVQTLESPGLSTLLGRKERTSPVWAALVNGVAAQVEDFGDIHRALQVGLSAALVPAALAAAELRNRTGAHVVDSIAIGAEVGLRIAKGLGPSHRERGWDISATAGGIAAAAASGRLLGLDGRSMQMAIALATTQSAGLLVSRSAMTGPLQMGQAAANGLEAALLAEAGFSGAEAAVEGRRGLGFLTSRDPDYGLMVERLNQTWEAAAIMIKPFACSELCHPAIEAALALRPRVASTLDIATVLVVVNPTVLEVDRPNPRTGLEAKLSLQHCVAVSFLDGSALPSQFTDARVQAPDAAALRRKIDITTDPRIDPDEARMSVETLEGEVPQWEVLHGIGKSEVRLIGDQLYSKLRSLAAPTLGPRTDAFIKSCQDVDKASARWLTSASTPPVAPGR